MISVYVVALLISITIANRTSLVNFKIEPYISGSNSVDFFLPLIVTAPFTWEIYYMKKDNSCTLAVLLGVESLIYFIE